MELCQAEPQVPIQLQELWLPDSLQLFPPSGSASAFQARSKYSHLKQVAVAKRIFFLGMPTSSGRTKYRVKVLAISAQFLQQKY